MHAQNVFDEMPTNHSFELNQVCWLSNAWDPLTNISTTSHAATVKPIKPPPKLSTTLPVHFILPLPALALPLPSSTMRISSRSTACSATAGHEPSLGWARWIGVGCRADQ
uniref:Uncharacterized protein n=1 Tax=Oryza punctata TaxID=4537 RepID=A0A0E0LZ18_ORYPU